MKDIRKLLLIRHAEAETTGFLTDRARQLTARGMADARHLGVFLRDNGMVPGMALCSPAIRTRQTLHGILESVPIAHREYPETMYDASAGHLFEWLRRVENRHQTVIMIGHNPGIHMLARSLSGMLSVTAPERFLSFPQGTLAIFECGCLRWEDLDFSSGNELTHYLFPADYRNFTPFSESAISS